MMCQLTYAVSVDKAVTLWCMSHTTETPATSFGSKILVKRIIDCLKQNPTTE